ncbi:hypothetical protein EIP91_004940 [Steccherinum ochraceum]|uniref:Ubiquitin-like domain-containing protein n=1 Tax=Steccherinum ochraceum TaxID=92696 RepID=A0A4R0RG93_9APHY|nr:hypothetical protein EIP91_004940 [Steccherinum ochraceum]
MSDGEQHATQDPIEPKAEDANAPINIKVVTQTGEEVFFKIKRNTKLSKLQGAYATKAFAMSALIRVNGLLAVCARDELWTCLFLFLYDGERVQEHDTPSSLNMEDNDTIDVMVEQVGGSA